MAGENEAPCEKLAENRGAADGETDGGKEPKGEMSITTPVESTCLPVFMPIHIQIQIQEQIYQNTDMTRSVSHISPISHVIHDNISH